MSDKLGFGSISRTNLLCNLRKCLVWACILMQRMKGLGKIISRILSSFRTLLIPVDVIS